MLKKVLMCITCLACLFGCSSTKEETKESSKDQTVAKEEVKEEDKQDEITTEKKEESYDKKDTSNSSSDKKQSSNKDSEVKSTITQSNKNSTTSESITNSNTSTSGSKPNQNNTSSKPSSKPTEEPATPTPETVQPSYVCPGGVNQNVSCDVILDSNFYYATYNSMSEAESAGEYYMNDVMYIGNAEVTNYSVQPVYRNDHSIAYYGLNLWSNGSLIQ